MNSEIYYKYSTYIPNEQVAVILLVAGIILIGSFLILGFLNYQLFKRHYNLEGWKAFVPFYNSFIIFEKTFGEGRGILFLFTFIPYLGFPYALYAYYKQLKSLNRGIGLLILSIFVPIIPQVILVFGSETQYLGPQSHIFIDKGEV